MRIQKTRCTCECGEVFESEIVVECPIAVAAASMEAIRCPECGGKKVGLGGGYKDAEEKTGSIAQRASRWLLRGDTGTSSKTIYSKMMVSPIDEHDIPHDPADFYRCRKLLDLIPEWRARLPEMAKSYPYWQPFVEAWDQFDALFDEELPTGKAPKLFEAMKIAEKQADKIRRQK